jgi:hypothetical protein
VNNIHLVATAIISHVYQIYSRLGVVTPLQELDIITACILIQKSPVFVLSKKMKPKSAKGSSQRLLRYFHSQITVHVRYAYERFIKRLQVQQDFSDQIETTPYHTIPITPPSRIATGADTPNHRPPTKDVAVTTTHHGSPPRGEPDLKSAPTYPISKSR